MTLNDIERQNRGFYGFFGDFGLRDTLQEQIAPKPIEIDMARGHQKRYPRKSRDEMAGDRLPVCEQELL